MLEGSKACCHIGPSVLIQQILFKVDSVPIFIAGGIATCRMMAHLLMMGFDSRLPVIPVRALKNEGTIEFGKLQMELLYKLDRNLINREEALYSVERFWVGAFKRAAKDGDITRGSLMVGQSVGLAHEVKPLKSIIDEMVSDAESEFQRLKKLVEN